MPLIPVQPKNSRSRKDAQQAQFDRRLDRGTLTLAAHEQQSGRLRRKGAGARERRVLKQQIKLADKLLAREKITVEQHAARVAQLRAKLGEEWQPGSDTPAAPAPPEAPRAGNPPPTRDWARNPAPAHAARRQQAAERRVKLTPPAGFETLPAFFEAVHTLLRRLPTPHGGRKTKEGSIAGAARACDVTERSVRRWLAPANALTPEQPRITSLARWYRRVLRQNP